MSNEKDEELVDIGALVLEEAAREFSRTGKPAFSYVPAGPEKLVHRELTEEERIFAQKSCWETAR